MISVDLKFTVPLSEVTIDDVPDVGGKNASLGEMISTLHKKGIPVPGGYAITAAAYRHFLAATGLEEFIKEELKDLNASDLKQLSEKGSAIRRKIIQTPFPRDLEDAIREMHKKAEHEYGNNADFAVRSSATAEDLPDASFAGEHETYLNVRGIEDTLIASKKAMASLFNDRAISYRVDKHFDHFKVALSVGVQKMIRSDLACSGIMFSLDTESGFSKVVVINGSYGLGEMVVQGAVTPDEYIVFKETLNKENTNRTLQNFFKDKYYKPIITKKLGHKDRKMVYSTGDSPTKIVPVHDADIEKFVLTDDEVLKLATWAVEIEKHYTEKHGKWTPMDMEWAKDGHSGKLFIVQARPETIHSTRDFTKMKTYTRTQEGKPLVKGASVGNKIATGNAHVIYDPTGIKDFKAGEILVTDITDPDWEPIMKIASAIVTNKGGRTSHAAIVSRELGIPCIVGSENATKALKSGQMVTVDTTGAEGLVFDGKLSFTVSESDTKKLPETKTHIMVNIATPETAFEKSFLPNHGVGLAREEFIIASAIGIHPMALLNYKDMPKEIKTQIDAKTVGYDDKVEFYVDNLAYGIAKICAAFYPNQVLVRLSDFKTNEYRTLIGGDRFEPQEENPMIGWRGASRYYHPEFVKAFELEIRALKKVREEMGLINAMVMVPFCRTPEEGQKVVEIMEKNDLSRKKDKALKIYVMCEIPTNVLLADDYLEIFDGMSIGSNDLTQLTLGIDRDGNERIRSIANENNPAVKELIRQAIRKCRAKGKYIGICGQAPSDYPDFAAFLVQEGIESISLNPDSVINTIGVIHREENKLS